MKILSKENKIKLLEEQENPVVAFECTHSYTKKSKIEKGEWGQDDLWCYYECTRCLKQTEYNYKTWALYP